MRFFYLETRCAGMWALGSLTRLEIEYDVSVRNPNLN